MFWCGSRLGRRVVTVSDVVGSVGWSRSLPVREILTAPGEQLLEAIDREIGLLEIVVDVVCRQDLLEVELDAIGWIVV